MRWCEHGTPPEGVWVSGIRHGFIELQKPTQAKNVYKLFLLTGTSKVDINFQVGHYTSSEVDDISYQLLGSHALIEYIMKRMNE